MDGGIGAELRQYLGNVAELIEISAEDAEAAEQAAKTVRDSKA